MVDAYPLQWPIGYPRTIKPERSRFIGQPNVIQKTLLEEIRKIGGKNPLISTNIHVKPNGLPYAKQLRIQEDKGVAVYFELNGKQAVMACDKWDDVHDNMKAISKTIEAMRGMDRWGVSDILNRSFTGFTALPEKIELEWHQILNIAPNANWEDAYNAYRQLVKLHHPDRGGNAESFQKIQDAYNTADKLLRRP